MKDTRNMGADEYQDTVANSIEDFRQYLEENASILSCAAQWGDGECGVLIETMKEVLLPARFPSSRPKYKKKKIDNLLRTAVFERDAYRCLRCESWSDLRADHVIPEAEGGEASLENLQTLCRSCNSWKGTKTIDFRGCQK